MAGADGHLRSVNLISGNLAQAGPDAPCLLPDLFGVFTARRPDFAAQNLRLKVKLAYAGAEYLDTSLDSSPLPVGSDANLNLMARPNHAHGRD
jgi:hypothetical protein